MKIQEAINITGVSRKALQYYEDKHLIHVGKDASGYRIYDEVCINRLWKIKVLRKMDFSIQEIELIMKEEQREEIFKKHFNEIDQRMAQCMIQKDYLEKLYDDFEHVSDPQLFQQLDKEMEEDFKRNEEIIVDIKKRKPHVMQIMIIILSFLIGICYLVNEPNKQSRVFGMILVFVGIYKCIELSGKKETVKYVSPINMMIDDGVSKTRAFFERRKKL